MPSPTAPVCPRCSPATLRERFGVLHEDVCARCRGRFLPPDAVERVIVEELGVTRALLRELVAHFASKERAPCPACRSKLSPLHVRAVRIDLCTGCGGVWLDGGELTTLTSGRYVELTPESAAPAAATTAADLAVSAPSTSASPGLRVELAALGVTSDGSLDDGSPVQLARAPGRVVVFFRDPDAVAVEGLIAAFAKTRLLAAQDAQMIARRKSAVAAEGLEAADAQRLVDALADAGIPAAPADDSWTQLPPPVQTNALEVSADGIVLGRGDPTSRVTARWADVAAIAAGIVTKTSMRAHIVTRKHRASPRHDEVEQEHELVTSDDATVDVVLTNPPRRLRVTLATLIFGADASGRPRPRLLEERLRAVATHAPAEIALGRGVHKAAAGGALPKYLAVRDFEREVCWLLWTRYGDARAAESAKPASG